MLRELLDKMYQDAFMRANVPQKRKLNRGLHLTLTCHEKGVTLTLSRDSQTPSMGEWQTCLNNFPYFTGKIVPRKAMIDGRQALIGELPSRTQVAEQMRLDQLR